MMRDYTITPVVLGAIEEAVADGQQWAAYNTSFRTLDVEDLFFTDNQMEAVWYADFKTNEIDQYSFRKFDSVEDFLYKISQTNEPSFFIEHKTNNMNNENVDFLQNQIKYAGFGEGLAGALVKEMKAGNEEFKLPYSHTFGKDNVEASLNFKKSKESDKYFFNSYDVTVNPEKGKSISNTFFINQGQSITLKEGYNLLNGRSVEKELMRNLTPTEKAQYKEEMKLPREQRGLPENWEKVPTYKAWIKLDLKHTDSHGNFIQKPFNENYGFRLEESLAKLPLRKMDASQKDDLLGSLRKGNIAQVGFTVDGVDKKMFLAADPQWKAITVYNADMTVAKKETYSQNTKKEREQAPVQGQQQTNGVQQEAAQQKDVVANVQQTAARKDLVAGPEAPWEGKKTNATQQPAEEKKSNIGQQQGLAKKPVTKADLLGKGKEKNGLIERKNTNKEGKAMKVA